MKKTLLPLLLLSLLPALFFSCDPEPETAFRSDLPGRWRISGYTTSGTETLLNNDGTLRERNVTTTVTNNDLEITFSDNPARYFSEGTYTVNYEFEEDGVTSSLATVGTGIGQGTWTYDNGRLEMVSHQGAEIYQFERIIRNEDGTLHASGNYELRRISSEQPKTAELVVDFALSPL